MSRVRFKLIVVLYVLIFTISTCVVSVSALDLFGDKVNLTVRFDTGYQCIMPQDTGYRYCYVLSGSGDDFNFIDSPYILVWSTDKLVVELKDEPTRTYHLVLTEPIYYIAADYLSTIENALFERLPTGVMPISCFKSPGADLEFKNIDVIYSNESYSVNGKSHSAFWPVALTEDLATGVGSYLGRLYTSLTSEGIYIFGTKVSFYAIIAGPFVISIAIIFLDKFFQIGSNLTRATVRSSKNFKKPSKKGGR